jgi:hypothetical protein
MLHQSATAVHATQTSLEVRIMFFQWECEKAAHSVRNGAMLQQTVDRLHRYSVIDGLVNDLGNDCVQAMMAAAFLKAAR